MAGFLLQAHNLAIFIQGRNRRHQSHGGFKSDIYSAIQIIMNNLRKYNSKNKNNQPVKSKNFTYKKKSYSNVLNGQTGVLGGKTPVSPWKVMLVVLIPILLLALPIILSLIFGK